MTGRDPGEVAAAFHQAQATTARILAATPTDVRLLAGRLLDLQPNHQENTTMALTIEPATASALNMGMSLLLAACAPDGADDV